MAVGVLKTWCPGGDETLVPLLSPGEKGVGAGGVAVLGDSVRCGREQCCFRAPWRPHLEDLMVGQPQFCSNLLLWPQRAVLHCHFKTGEALVRD